MHIQTTIIFLAGEVTLSRSVISHDSPAASAYHNSAFSLHQVPISTTSTQAAWNEILTQDFLT